MSQLDTAIEYLKGVGPQRADLLKKELGVFTFYDLLQHIPFRYVDKSQFYLLSDVMANNSMVQVRGVISHLQEIGAGRKKRLEAIFKDDSGEVKLVWFKGVQWLKKSLKVGPEYVLFGKPSSFNGSINFTHPELEILTPAHLTGQSTLTPVYSSTEKLSGVGLHTKGIEKLMRTLLVEIKDKIPETLTPELGTEFGLINRPSAFFNVHFPQNQDSLNKARFRLKFEELFYLQTRLIRMKLVRTAQNTACVFPEVGHNFLTFYKEHIPFELTGAQKRVIKEVRKDVGSGKQMNRLLQGDVGSGKTMVALLCMLLASDNGYQSALMAPTEILAVQHFEGIKELMAPMNVKVELLTGSTKTARRREIHEGLENGEIDILIGTHALIEDKVQFKNLGLVVVDEQHRFGVAQRSRLWAKNTSPPHILVMSATPIPRTLAMTLYGDLDVSVIDELPPGRKPIETRHVYDAQRLKTFEFMRREIAKGRQVYVVYPLIEESAKLDYKDLEDGYESISRAFQKPDYQISVVHGRMKAEDKDYEMNRFVKGETQIMIATTVIEVGVNVPNASVMIIESAERFGLSQLHQLRGRVGRGAEQSYCLLVTGYKLSADTKTRMETMVRTNDGFEVAEVDLRLRGPGDIMGTQQSGVLDLKMADLVKDSQIMQTARQAAFKVLKEDPNLKMDKNKVLRHFYQKFVSSRPNWSRIS